MIINTSSVVVIPYASCSTTILKLLKDDYAVGIYSVIYAMVGILLVVTINGKRRAKEYRDVLQSVIDTLSVLGLPAAVGLVMLSKEVILIIAEKKYRNEIFSLQIITWAMVNVGLNFILIPLWLFDGAALTTVIAKFMIMTLNGWSARDYVGPILRSKQTRKNLVNFILLKLGIPSLILRTILSFILSVGIYAVILILCGNKIVMDYFLCL